MCVNIFIFTGFHAHMFPYIQSYVGVTLDLQQPALGRKADDKHMWLASEGQSVGGIGTNIAICTHVATCSD